MLTHLFREWKMFRFFLTRNFVHLPWASWKIFYSILIWNKNKFECDEGKYGDTNDSCGEIKEMARYLNFLRVCRIFYTRYESPTSFSNISNMIEIVQMVNVIGSFYARVYKLSSMHTINILCSWDGNLGDVKFYGKNFSSLISFS